MNNEQIQCAVNLINTGNFSEVEAFLLTLFAQNSQDAQVLYLLGRMYEQYSPEYGLYYTYKLTLV